MKAQLLSLILLVIVLTNSYSQQKKYNSRDEIPMEYKWDLTIIYQSWEAWESDLSMLQKDVADIQKYKGVLTAPAPDKANTPNGKNETKPETLKLILDAKFKMMNKATRLYSFIALSRSVDSRNPGHNAREQYLSNKLTTLEQEFAWFEPELASLSKDEVIRWTELYSYLKPYHHYLADFFRQREHILAEDQQKIMSIAGTGLFGYSDIYTTLTVSDMQFEKVTISTGEEIVANMPNMDRFNTICPDQNDRKRISDANLGSFTKNKYTLAAIYASILKSRWANAHIYKYPSCLNFVLESDNIPESVYINFLDVAETGNITFQKYLQLRKKALKLDTLYKSDLNISLVDFRRSYTYEETAQIVRKSLAFFGDEYEKMVNNFLVSGNIDVYPVPGKISGAFSLNVPEVHPFLLLNFSGTRGNVFTLAHETGHAIHSAFADKTQPPASRAYPVFVAEVASIVNEFVLLDYMVKNAQSSEEKIDLLNQEINNLFGKFYRTAQLSEFEYKAYKRIENNLPVDIESLSSVFDSIEYKYYGKELCREPDEKYGWFRTQHLYNKYFYLFQYATSYSAALSIYKGISEEKDKEKRQELIEKYLNLLKAGGKDYPVDLLKLAGIDLTARKPYEDVVAYLKTLVDKLEWELKQAGKI